MHRAALLLAAAALLATAGLVRSTPCSAQDDGADAGYWAVVGVRADDVLHMRDVPNAESRSVVDIPPNARGLKNLGCRRSTLTLDDWARMTKEERARAETRWCRVEYNGRQGWVAARYLKKDSAPAP